MNIQLRARLQQSPNLGRCRRSGSVLLFCLIVLTVVASLAASSYVVHVAEEREASGLADDLRAVQLAEAGIADSALAIVANLDAGLPVPAGIASQAAQVQVRGGSYWTTITDNADGTWTVVSSALTRLHRQTLEAVLVESPGDIYDHAVFAGNAAGNPGYTLSLSGVGVQGDQIIGNVHSGGDISVSGDASVSGTLSAAGSIAGALGSTGTTLAAPDLVAMNYAATADVDVASAFATAAWGSDGWSNAWQLPESEPAHIFRKNPDDRTSETSATTKDDYFLEDPYEATATWTTVDGGDGMDITLSGVMGKPGISGTERVYYIDGNLWVHNAQMLGMRLKNTDPDGSRITIVASGNIYLSDDLTLWDPAQDGIALIAMEDPGIPDSGNVYLGDSLFGTLNSMQAFIYAENTFYDRNLDASGSQTLKLKGNMTAGGEVSIMRDYVDANGNPGHSRLDIEFDDRISTGALSLPGLPGTAGPGSHLTVGSWRVVPNP